jgi:hypothetical protein
MVQNSSVCEIKVPDLGMGYGSWDLLDTQGIKDTTTEDMMCNCILPLVLSLRSPHWILKWCLTLAPDKTNECKIRRLSCGWDHSADCLSAGCVVPDARLLENGRRANEADRHDQLHEEYRACGGTLDVPAAAASMANGSGDRVAAHGMCGRTLGQDCG